MKETKLLQKEFYHNYLTAEGASNLNFMSNFEI